MRCRFWRARCPGTATEWFARLRSSQTSPEIDMQFREWLAQNSENEAIYERQELAWELSMELSEDSEIANLVHNAEISENSERSTSQDRSAMTFRFSVAAAISVLIGLAGILWWRIDTNKGVIYATDVGEERTVLLPDRSQITLNTATRVRVVYSGSLRSVYLEQGEATFSVAHDAEHPFVVSAAGTKARAIGTEFNVLKRDQGVVVSVLEGRVEVSPEATRSNAANASRTVLSIGEEVAYQEGRFSPVRAAQTERIDAWHNRKVAFQGVALDEALAEFNRYITIRIVLGDPSLRAYRVSGVFRVGETQALLNALLEVFGVTSQQRGDIIILWPKEKTSLMTELVTTNRARG
jgi:transmembrane sensor